MPATNASHVADAMAPATGASPAHPLHCRHQPIGRWGEAAVFRCVGTTLGISNFDIWALAPAVPPPAAMPHHTLLHPRHCAAIAALPAPGGVIVHGWKAARDSSWSLQDGDVWEDCVRTTVDPNNCSRPHPCPGERKRGARREEHVLQRADAHKQDQRAADWSNAETTSILMEPHPTWAKRSDHGVPPLPG